MNKSYGKWEKKLINALDAYEAIYVTSLLPKNRTKSEFRAILRATKKLKRAGIIKTMEYQHGRPKLVAMKNNYSLTSRKSIVSVDKVQGDN